MACHCRHAKLHYLLLSLSAKTQLLKDSRGTTNVCRRKAAFHACICVFMQQQVANVQYRELLKKHYIVLVQPALHKQHPVLYMR